MQHYKYLKWKLFEACQKLFNALQIQVDEQEIVLKNPCEGLFTRNEI